MDILRNLTYTIHITICTIKNCALLFQGLHQDAFTPGNGKQELYPGAGVYISCVELHHIHDKAGYSPSEIITSMMALFFSEDEMATSVPFRENGSKQKGKVLQQNILHAIIGNYKITKK